jgi:serine/threonine protein kinase
MSQGYESFGKYILLEKLAVGGMAEIYLARSSGASGVGKFVAIKRILPQFTEQTEFIDMFKDEAKIAVNLSHANVVSIYEFGLVKNSFFLAMDYIEGRNLRQILNKMKKSSLSFSIEQVLYIVKEVAAGLDHAHRCIDANTGKPLNIIHRDMSPQNVMVSFEGEVKIVDFGIAKAETQLETTRAGTLKGKFGYMSPEQAEGQPVDLRTDVFALGIVLWELLANDRLFVANNEVNTLRKIRDCQVPSLRKINPNIAPELERIVGKALAKDRNLRYQTAAAFHRDLSRFLNRQYPDFSPQDFSVFVKTLFAGEILESRKKMVDFARIDLNRQTKEEVARAESARPTYENTVVTNTQDTMSSTQADEDTGEASVSGIDFENPDHDKPTPKQTQPSVTKPIVPPARQSVQKAAQQPIQQVSSKPVTKTAAPKEKSKQADPPGFNARPEGWQSSRASEIPSTRELPRKAGEDAVLGGRLVMDRSAFRNDFGGREGTYGTRSISRPIQRESSSKFLVTLVFFGLIAAAGAYYFSNPPIAIRKMNDLLIAVGAFEKPQTNATDQSSIDANKPLKSGAEQVVVYVSSAPSGAPISINGEPTGEVTPAPIKLEKGRKVQLSLKLAGYLPSPYEERFVVDGPRSIDVRFKADVKGFLNIIVVGEGQIYVNDAPVASTSPARMIPVPANEAVRVMVYDPKTRARDEKTVQVGEGQTFTVKLEPKVGFAMPEQQAPAPTRRK